MNSMMPEPNEKGIFPPPVLGLTSTYNTQTQSFNSNFVVAMSDTPQVHSEIRPLRREGYNKGEDIIFAIAAGVTIAAYLAYQYLDIESANQN